MTGTACYPPGRKKTPQRPPGFRSFLQRLWPRTGERASWRGFLKKLKFFFNLSISAVWSELQKTWHDGWKLQILLTPWSKYMANRPQKVGKYGAYINQYMAVTMPIFFCWCIAAYKGWVMWPVFMDVWICVSQESIVKGHELRFGRAIL